MFIPFIHIYSEQEYSMNVLKDILFVYGRLYVWPKASNIWQTVVEGNILRIVEQPYPLTAKACKIRIYECVKSIFVDSNFSCMYALYRARLYYLYDKRKNIG